VAIDGKYVGNLGVADLTKASTPEARRDLKAHAFAFVMLTGDNQAVAAEIAKKLGIEDSKPKSCRKEN